MRTINIVIGSKAYFQEQIKDLSDAVSFLDLIKLSDAYHGKNQVFPDELKTAGSVNLSCDKAKLAFDISDKILEYAQNGDDNFIIEEYKNRLFVVGKQISYTKNNIEYKATVKGINTQCNLIVERDDGFADILSSGEISIKI